VHPVGLYTKTIQGCTVSNT